MSEQDAREWIAQHHGAVRAEQVAAFLDMVVEENQRQNLIAPSTIATIWQRHALDSAQLLRFDSPGCAWLDLGTGGGFPGMIVALLRSDPVHMVEPRARRAAFLATCVERLGLRHAHVAAVKVERWEGRADIVSARAVASLDKLFAAAQHCTGRGTRWLVPKGRSAAADLDEAQTRWLFMFHVEQSLSDPDSAIVVAEGLQRR